MRAYHRRSTYKGESPIRLREFLIRQTRGFLDGAWIRSIGRLSLSKGQGAGEGLFSRTAPIEFKTPHLKPLPLSKGRGEVLIRVGSEFRSCALRFLREGLLSVRGYGLGTYKPRQGRNAATVV
jgi:hypothetical protein